MTKKKKVSPVGVRKYQAITFKVEESVAQPTKAMPSNLAEEKAKFLKSGKTPQFHIQDPSKLAELASKSRNQIRFDLLGEAEYILEKVRDEYGEGDYFLEHMFGPRITKEEATPMLLEYIEENSLTESIKIHWCDNMPCSAKMVWTGPVVNANKPELRRYSLWINGSDESNYMRESGIKCLMDHEIGTHFFRMLNDGFQPWFSDRARFGLRGLGAFEGQCSEEGLATINTCLRGRVKLLWGSALAYYTACKATEMTFKQLFDHIGRYISNPDSRWKQVMRVKRGLTDPNDLGGFGNDQCYFEGAVNILRNMDKIDFHLLMSGKVCYDELDRIKRVVRKDAMKYPVFMKNMNAYLKTLKKMVTYNNLGAIHPHRSPPTAYLRRLDERKAEGHGRKPKKVRSCTKIGKLKFKGKALKKKYDEDEIVKSFTVSERFVNTHLNKKFQEEQEKIKLKHDNRINTLVENINSKISDLDDRLDKTINHCNELVSEHSWSSQEYKETVLSHVSSDICSDELDVEMMIKTKAKLNFVENFVSRGRIEETGDNYEVTKLQLLNNQNAKIKSDSWTKSEDMETEKSINFDKDINICHDFIQERPWTEGTRSASSLRGELFSSNLLRNQPNSSIDSLPNLKHRRKKSYRNRSSTVSHSEDSQACMSDSWVLKSTAHNCSDYNNLPTVSKVNSKEVFNNKRINFQKQKQLLHPSIARLTSRDNLGTQTVHVKERLNLIEKVTGKLNDGNNNNGLKSFKCGIDEDTAALSLKNAPINTSNDSFELTGMPLSENAAKTLKKIYDNDHDMSLKHVVSTTQSSALHQRPQRIISFRNAQKKMSAQNSLIISDDDLVMSSIKVVPYQN